MKKMLFLSTLAGAIALVATGCTSVVTSDGATAIPQPTTCADGYKAQFQHQNVRVTGNSQVNVLFGIFAWGANGFAENSDLSTFSFLPSPVNFAKSAAVYEACQANKVDTLLGTRYTVTTTDYFVFKTLKCEVAGFPAKMTDVTKLDAYVLRGKESDTIVYLDAAPKVIK